MQELIEPNVQGLLDARLGSRSECESDQPKRAASHRYASIASRAKRMLSGSAGQVRGGIQTPGATRRSAYDAAAFEPSAMIGSAAEELMVCKLSSLERIGFEPSVSATDDAVEIVVFSYSAFLFRPEKQQLVHREGTSGSNPICSANRWLLVMRSSWDFRLPGRRPRAS